MKKSAIFLQIFIYLSICAFLSTKDAAGQGVSHSKKCQGVTKRERAFLEAVVANKLETVKILLDRGISANTTDTCETSALRFAVRGNHTEMVTLLLQAGAEVKSENFLIYAFDDREDEEDEEIGSREEDNFSIVKALIDAGADVNLRKDSAGETPLIAFAAKSNRIKSLELLLRAGAEANAQDTRDKTALSYATEKGYVEAKTLLKSFGANATEAVKWYKEKYGDNAFIQATSDGRADVVEAMIENGFDVNTQNAAGVTALMRVKNTGTLQVLLDAGANVHLRDNAGFTALIHVTGTYRAKTVKGLLQAGADVEAKTPDGKTALMFASLQGDVVTVQALLGAGAKVNERDNSNRTATSHALARNKLDVFKILRQAGGVQ
jgi:uncharacterized protein